MSPRPDPAALARLAQLAAMKRDAELARLAGVAQSRARLQSAVDALKRTEAPLDADDTDPALVQARLVHRRWTESQHRRLNQQLALVTADWLRQRPAAARAFGRAAVLSELTTRVERLRAATKQPP